MKKAKTIYEDEYLKVINKTAGIVSTEISPLICHRLDRDTSGLLVVAKSEGIKKKIQAQFKQHRVKKRYLALVSGIPSQERGRLEGYIVRHKKNEAKRRFINALNFAIKKRHKRYAVSEYEIKKKYQKDIFKNPSQKSLNLMSLVEIRIFTGRTHQIRAQFALIHHPVIGDLLYGGKLMRRLNTALNIRRQFLHAYKISFIHPKTGKNISLKSELPDNLKKVLEKLDNYRDS